MVDKEAVMMVGIVLSVAVWLSIPPVLSRVMARHGCDRTSYLVVGALFGPLAIVFAVLEVLFDVPERARILDEGRTGQGDLSVLVVVSGESATSPPTKALAGLRPRLRRVGLALVLPKGGPRADERRADQALREPASAFDHPELALLFGRPDVAIPEHADSGGYDLVFTSGADPALSARLTEAGRVHCCGDQERLFGPGRLPLARRWSDDTEALPPSAARTRSARTA
jgi:hypothetical protein